MTSLRTSVSAPLRAAGDRIASRLPARYESVARAYPGFVLASAALLALTATWPFVDWWLRASLATRTPDTVLVTTFEFYDWGAYTGALDRWHEGQSIYTRDDQGGYWGSYLYPPLVLVVFVPFTWIAEPLASALPAWLPPIHGSPFAAGAATWGLATMLACWGALVVLVDRLGYRLRWWELALTLWALFGFHPLLFSLKMGQTAAFQTALLALAGVALLAQRGGEERAGVVAGLLTGVVGFVKLAYAPVGAHLLADWRRLAGAVAAGLALVGLSLVVFGVDLHRQYLEVLAWGASGGGTPRPPTPGLWLPGYFMPLGWLPGSLLLRALGSLAVVGAVLGGVVAGIDHEREAFALGLAAAPVLAPTTYTYYLAALVPATAVLVATEVERDGLPGVAVVGLTLAAGHAYGLRLVTVTFYETIPFVATTDWLPYLVQPGLWGVLVVAGLAWSRIVGAVWDHLPDGLRGSGSESAG